MTAVAHAPNFQAMKGWAGSNGAANGLGGSMNTDDMSRLLLQPRKTAQRTNSSSSLNSLSSSTSSNSTISAASAQSNGANGANGTTNGDWGSRKRTARSLWPASKSEPIAGLSNARPQTMASTSSGPSAASAISALHTPSNMVQPTPQAQTQTNGLSRPQQQPENLAVLYLTPMNGTFERKTITVPFYPDVLRIGRQTNNKTLPTPQNGYFDSKVLSRSHAEIWADRNGKIWIRDVKSSNGTFVNGQRLSQENKDSDPHELREQDMLELGIDIVSEDQKTVVHHKVAARVEHAGFYGANNVLDLNFGDIDSNASAGLMGSALQGMGAMRRTGSQSSLGSNGRMSTASTSASNIANMQQRQQHFWLTPVNMDKIIQKLNAEYKAAKQQSLDLQRTAQYIDSVLTSEQSPSKTEGQKTSPIEKTKGMKTRFSDPPAPPPQAPLPEKPDAALQRAASGLGLFQPASLSRSDTEKPKLTSSYSSPIKPPESLASAAQIANLVESLTKSKQEAELTTARLREVEDQLVQERVRREDAEERAKRLEKERKLPEMQRLAVPATSAKDEESTTPIEEGQQDEPKTDEAASTKKLQERLDLLLVEFREVQATAERWKHDKELAEQERDEERKERKTLAEMVEQLRAQETERVEKEKKREIKRGRRRSRSASNDVPAANAATDGAGSEDVVAETHESESTKGAQQNGHPFVQQNHPQGSDQSDTAALAQRGPQLAQAAPYISAVSVVFLGVAIMALINKMHRGESIKG